jgi:hypothetical protein
VVFDYRPSPILENNYPLVVHPSYEIILNNKATDWLIAQDDGTDIESRNVGYYTSDAGEIPRRIQNTTDWRFIIVIISRTDVLFIVIWTYLQVRVGDLQ